MPYATDSDLLARVPELSSVAVATRELALGDAKDRISDVAFGQRTLQAHVYLTAHILTIWDNTLAGGEMPPVSALSAAEASTSWAVAAVDPESIARTKWGRFYLEIARAVHNRPVAV